MGVVSPAYRSHSDGAVPAQRQVPALGEGLDGSALIQDDHQVGHLGKGAELNENIQESPKKFRGGTHFHANFKASPQAGDTDGRGRRPT